LNFLFANHVGFLKPTLTVVQLVRIKSSPFSLFALEVRSLEGRYPTGEDLPQTKGILQAADTQGNHKNNSQVGGPDIHLHGLHGTAAHTLHNILNPPLDQDHIRCSSTLAARSIAFR
jgi:hypothetical protein